MVIVVAEGASAGVRDMDSLKKTTSQDKSGNVKLSVIKNLIIGFSCIFENRNS